MLAEPISVVDLHHWSACLMHSLANRFGRLRLQPLIVVVALSGVAVGLPSSVAAQSSGDVDAAQQARDEAYQRLVEVRAQLDDAVAEHQQIRGDLEGVTFRIARLTDRIAGDAGEVRRLRRETQEAAAEAYMLHGTSGIVEVAVGADSVQDILSATYLLARSAVATDNVMNRYIANGRQLERLQEELIGEQQDLEALRQNAIVAAEAVQLLMDRAADEFSMADAAAVQARERYEAEQRRIRQEEERRRKETAGGVDGLVCPVQQPVSFINDWGFARSGGRKHQGTDMFSSYGNEIYAVTGGTVKARNHGLGGIHVWLYGDDGNSYYYAHMSGWGPGIETGVSVDQGQVIGYIGTSGNAAGTPPHNHFEIHRNRGSATNPYPTLRSVCG